MITISFRLSESLLSILRDSGAPRPETSELQVPSGTTVNQILAGQNISPLLVPMVSFNGGSQTRRIDKSEALTSDGVLTLYGPLAGG